MSTQLSTGQYLGATVRRTESDGVVLSEVRHPHARPLPPHSHESSYFSLLLDGHYVEEIGRLRFDYGRFAMGFHPAGLFHHDRIGDTGARMFLMAIAQSWAARWQGHFDQSLAAAPKLLSHDATLVAARLWGWQCRGALTDDLVDAAICEVLGEAAGVRTPADRCRPAWIARALDMICAATDRPISVVDVASELDLHPVYVAREFRRRLGRTIGEHARGLRIRAACAMLPDGGLSLADIAVATGFADQSHFTRVFAATLGCTPAAYRRLLDRVPNRNPIRDTRVLDLHTVAPKPAS
jgi:AraC family transcriptional regulator